MSISFPGTFCKKEKSLNPHKKLLKIHSFCESANPQKNHYNINACTSHSEECLNTCEGKPAQSKRLKHVFHSNISYLLMNKQQKCTYSRSQDCVTMHSTCCDCPKGPNGVSSPSMKKTLSLKEVQELVLGKNKVLCSANCSSSTSSIASESLSGEHGINDNVNRRKFIASRSISCSCIDSSSDKK